MGSYVPNGDPSVVSHTPVFRGDRFLHSRGLSTVQESAFVDWNCSDGETGVRSAPPATRARRPPPALTPHGSSSRLVVDVIHM